MRQQHQAGAEVGGVSLVTGCKLGRADWRLTWCRKRLRRKRGQQSHQCGGPQLHRAQPQRIRRSQLHLGPYDDLKTQTLRLTQRPHCPRHRALVSDRQRGIAPRLRASHQFLGLGRALQEAEAAAAVKLGVGRQHADL